jgi:hypothetical protein
MSDYKLQTRGDSAAYARYLRGMNASMRQKVALTAAHLLAEGVVADMGMGSGSGSDALASLYPALTVLGVDVSVEMTVTASWTYDRENLSFLCADIATHCFAPGTLSGIFDSSVLHHVTTFNGYDHGAAARALAKQVEMLEEYGALIVRDFVDPGGGEVILELRDGDSDDADDVLACSSADLFRRFAREFRPLSCAPGFAYEELPARDGHRRFRTQAKYAAEFILRKDYRSDWATEVLEEYTYLTQREFESLFARLGLRILASSPIRNPWIVRNRFEGKVNITSVDGKVLEYPPTNYIIVGEKVPPGEGVRFVESEAAKRSDFLSIHCYRNTATGAVIDLVRRPHPTVDIVPWFESDGDVYVLGRKSYPRPIAGSAVAIDGSRAPTYVTEPLNVLQTDGPFGRTVEEALQRYAGIAPAQIRGFRTGCVYYPSPGGIEEEVRSALVEIEPLFVQARLDNLSGFSTSGRVRAIESTQLLRAAQVGGLAEARLELNVYHLLRQLGRDAGPWIGDAISLEREATELRAVSVAESRMRKRRRTFTPADGSESRQFLLLNRSRFDELDAADRVVASQELEYVVPATLSTNTVATALLARQGDRAFLGVDDDDLPAAQGFRGNSNLLVAPAWRLPKNIDNATAALAFVRERLQAEYGVSPRRTWELGGRYHPSPGVTPEIVFPYAIEVEPAGSGVRSLLWIDLGDLIENANELVDGHLAVVVFRAAHALGVRPQIPPVPSC